MKILCYFYVHCAIILCYALTKYFSNAISSYCARLLLSVCWRDACLHHQPLRVLIKNKNPHNMKILYFDDCHYLYASIRQHCRQVSYVVDIVSTEKQAFFQWKSNAYDILIIDLQADFEAGLRLIEKIRALDLDVPIIVTARHANRETKLRLLENFVDDYLEKPFNWEELIARLKCIGRRALRQSEGKNAIFDYGPVKLDQNNLLAKIYDQEVELGPKEFLILKYLMDNCDHLVTREELFFNLWDANADVFSNSVNVHLAKLSRKINALFSEKPLIQNLRGRGVKLWLPELSLCEAVG